MNKGVLALLVAVASSATPLMADEETVGGYTWTYGIDGDEAQIYGVTPAPAGAVAIPSLLGGKPMTSIGVSAFSGCTNMTSVTIPTGVTHIWDYAFYGCSGLTSVTIPTSVTSIEDSAFCGCSGLAKDGFVIVSGILFDYVGPGGNVAIPTGVTSIGYGAFEYCNGLTSVTIPTGVTSIGASAFYGCSALTNVTIPVSVKSIGSSAFRGCGGLAEDGFVVVRNVLFDYVGSDGDVVIPDGVESIGVRAFYHRRYLSSVTMPDGVTGIGSSAFYGCSSLTNVTFGNGVTSIGGSAFYGCSCLTNVAMPDGVTSIGSSAFYGCSSLTNVVIPGGVKKINASAFKNCSSLTGVAIPDGVRSIGASAFYGCSSLTSVSIPASVTSIGSSAFGKCGGLECVTIPQRVCSSKMKTIFPAAYQSITNVVIVDGVKKINSSVFSGCSGLFSVEIPGSVTNIGSSAFSGCCSLTSVAIPDRVKKIRSSTFKDCSGLTSVTIPTGVTSIGASAFSGCSALTDVTIPASVTSIGASAFYGCSGLIVVTIPDGVKSIEDSTFYDCGGLTSLVIPSSVTKIASSAFKKCSGLKSVTIPQCVCSSTMKKVFPSAYQSITNVVIAGDVTSIDGDTFSGCNDLIFDMTTIPGVKLLDGWVVGNTGELPEELDLTGIKGVGGKAFYNCKGLARITIPASVTSIGEKAFYGCRGLTNIVFEGDAPDVASSAFSSAGSRCTAFVTRDSVGWGVEIPGKWNGIAIAFSQDGVLYGGRLNVKFAKAQTVKGALIRNDKDYSRLGTVQVKVGRINARKKTVKITIVATLLVNGKAKKFMAKKVVSVDGSKRISPVTFSFTTKRIGKMSLEMGADGFFTLGSPSCAMAQATVGGALKGGARGTFRLEEFDLAVPGTLQDDLLPYEVPFKVVGKKWLFAKAAAVKWAKDRKTKVFGRVVDESKGKANRSGLKLSYAAKTGIFKGSFKAYSLQNALGGKKKMKKYKVNVVGYVVDGVGTGEASCKRPAGGPWAVTVE